VRERIFNEYSLVEENDRKNGDKNQRKNWVQNNEQKKYKYVKETPRFFYMLLVLRSEHKI